MPRHAKPDPNAHTKFLAMDPETRERVRKTIRKLDGDSRRKVTVKTVAAAAKVSKAMATKLLRWWRQDLIPDTDARWDGTTQVEPDEEDAPPEGLGEAIMACASHEDLHELAKRLTAELVNGRLTSQQVNAAKGMLNEARQNLRAHLDATEGHDPEQIVMAGPEAYALVRCFEGIRCDDRRARILYGVARMAAEDMEEYPNLDVMGGQDLCGEVGK